MPEKTVLVCVLFWDNLGLGTSSARFCWIATKISTTYTKDADNVKLRSIWVFIIARARNLVVTYLIFFHWFRSAPQKFGKIQPQELVSLHKFQQLSVLITTRPTNTLRKRLSKSLRMLMNGMPITFHDHKWSCLKSGNQSDEWPVGWPDRPDLGGVWQKSARQQQRNYLGSWWTELPVGCLINRNEMSLHSFHAGSLGNEPMAMALIIYIASIRLFIWQDAPRKAPSAVCFSLVHLL